MKEKPWNNKLICLDLKVLYNPETLSLLGGYNKRAILVRNHLNELLKEKQIKTEIVFEVFNEAQYRIFDSVFKGKTYWAYPPTSEADIKIKNKSNINLSLSLQGLPKAINPDQVKIQNLWTIETANDFFDGLVFAPAIMQGNNVPMMKFFKALQEGNSLHCIQTQQHNFKTKVDEFIHLEKIVLPLKKNRLIHLDLLGKAFPDSTSLIVEALDEENNIVNWQETDLKEKLYSYHFIDSKFLKSKNAQTVSFYIWNKSKSTLNHTYKLSQYELE